MRFQFGDCVLDTERFELRRAGQAVSLELRAFRVFAHLLRHAGQAVSKQELVQACWPDPPDATTFQEHALRNCLMKIRKAVGDAAGQQGVIETVRGYGYRVVATVTTSTSDMQPADVKLQDQTDSPAPTSPHAHTAILPGRRQLTALRCAIVEEPSWARLDPEDRQRILNVFYSACEQVIHRAEGYMALYDHVGVLAYFGYPTAAEDAARRAVHAGLQLVDALGRQYVHGISENPIPLAARLGIHTGMVVTDDVASEQRQTLVALGDAPQAAERLQMRAAPNTVIVSDATWRLAQGYFAAEPLAWRELEEMSPPAQAYRVQGASGAQSRLDAAPPWQLTPLVGREAELALLHDRWHQAQSGLGQVVALSGEPGIGKSRLAQAFHQRLADAPHMRLEWRCSPDAQQSPLQPVIDHWRQRLNQTPEDTPADRLHALEAALAAYEYTQPEAAPLFAALLSLPHPATYPPLTLSPQQQRQKTLEALRSWLLAEAARQPVLFIVEDLHWSDPSTLEFLTLLLDQGPIARLFVLLTCRPEFKAPWSFHAHCTPLTLARLPNELVTEMIARLAGHRSLPPHVITQIVAKTDGVPLFIEELTKMVLESERLQERVRRGGLPAPLPRLDIPATLHDSLMARLDRLGPVKALAQLGAVIGRVFAYDLLQTVADMDDGALQQGLRQLVEAELVYQQGIPPQASYVFKHALIQDAAAQSLLRRVRQHYHQRIAQALEAQFADIAADHPELPAHHYSEAGLPAQALPYYRLAGENALARSAFREAAALFEQALEAMQHLPESPDAMAQAIDLRLALRSALRPLGEFNRSLAALRQAETLADRLNDTRRLGQVAAFLIVQFRMMGAYEQGKTAAQRALAAASADGDALLGALAHQFLGIIHHDQGDYDQAIDGFEQALTALATIQQHEFDGVDLLPGMLSRATLASCHAERGAFAAGFALAHEALRIAEAAAHSSSLIYGYWAIGRLALRQGDAQRAISLLERSIDRCQQIGIPGYFARVAADLGAAYVLAGQVDDAVALLTQAWEQTAAPEMRGLQAVCGFPLAEAQMRAGRWEQAHAIAEQTLALTLARQERSHHAHTLRVFGDLAARRDSPEIERAEAFYQQALALAETLGMRPLQAHCHRSLGDLYRESGQPEQARAAWSTASEMYRDMEMTFWLPQAEAALGQQDETRIGND